MGNIVMIPTIWWLWQQVYQGMRLHLLSEIFKAWTCRLWWEKASVTRSQDWEHTLESEETVLIRPQWAALPMTDPFLQSVPCLGNTMLASPPTISSQFPHFKHKQDGLQELATMPVQEWPKNAQLMNRSGMERTVSCISYPITFTSWWSRDLEWDKKSCFF